MSKLLGQNESASHPVQILIVEDERAIARDLQESLEHLGYEVVALAGSSDEAIAQVEALCPNLVLMDIVLEGSDRDGIETAQEIHQRFGIPVVYLTAYANSSILERVKATDPFGYLLKPFRERELWVSIETALKRHSLERTLHEREEWLTHILAGMGDGVIVFDSSTGVRFLNPVAETLTEWAQAEALDRPIEEVLQIVLEQTRLPLLPELLQSVAQGEIVYLSLDALLISKSGQEIPIIDSAAPLRDKQSTITGGIIVFRDAYALRLANERNLAVARSQQLELQVREMENLNRLKDDFLSTVSHELRTPLSNIKMATHLLTIALDQLGFLAQSTGLSATAIAKYMDILRQETDQELNLINDLLDVQRLQAETYPLNLSLIELKTWISHIIEPFLMKAEAHQQKLLVTIPLDLPSLWTDAHVLTRIISELLNNACKYTPPGEQIRLTAQVQMNDLGPSQTWIILELTNSGVTISPEHQTRIFDAFYRIPQSDRWKRGGTGLGLALVKKFMSLLGGQIEMNSSSEQVCFRIFLPILKQPSTEEPTT